MAEDPPRDAAQLAQAPETSAQGQEAWEKPISLHPSALRKRVVRCFK